MSLEFIEKFAAETEKKALEEVILMDGTVEDIRIEQAALMSEFFGNLIDANKDNAAKATAIDRGESEFDAYDESYPYLVSLFRIELKKALAYVDELAEEREKKVAETIDADSVQTEIGGISVLSIDEKTLIVTELDPQIAA